MYGGLVSPYGVRIPIIQPDHADQVPELAGRVERQGMGLGCMGGLVSPYGTRIPIIH